MTIVVICEGATEAALAGGLREYLRARIGGSRNVGVTTRSLKGPTLRSKLARVALHALDQQDTVGVIALSDVYPSHEDAKQTKDALRRFAGPVGKDPRFRPHAAQFEVEAWILPFWDEIAKGLRVKAARLGANPEQVNGQTPPSQHLKELFRKARRDFDKIIDGPNWLTAERLQHAAQCCPELRAFLSSLLELAGVQKAD
jgi:hypothetical protein